MANCKVESVTAPNGKPSILYEDLLRITRDQERALDLYLEIVDTGFPAHERDSNGEPTIDAVADTGLLNHYENIRHQKGPQGFNQESIEDDVIDGIAAQVNFAIDELKRILNASRDEGERQKIEDQIEALQRDRGEIVATETIQSVRNAAKRQLDWAEDVTEREDVSVETVMQAIKLMDMWDYESTSNFLSSTQIEDDLPPNDLFRDASSRASNIQKKLVDKGMETIIDLVDQYSGVTLKKSDLQTFEDINSVKNWLYNISHVDNRLIGHFHKTLVSAKRRQDNELTDLKQEFDRLEQEEGVDPQNLLREDENGNKLAELISPYEKDYYTERSKALRKYYNAVDRSRSQDLSTADETIREAKKELYSDLNDLEQIIDIRIILDEFDTDTSLEEYKQNLIDKYGEEEAEFAIERSKLKWEQYKSRRQEFKHYLVNQIKANRNETREGESNQEWMDRKMREFREENSPVMYTQDRQDPSELEFARNTGWEYTYTLPKDTDNINEQFNNLNESEREMWDLMTSTIQESLSYLPPSIRRGMDETFLPKVKKDLVEMMQSKGIWEAIRFNMRDNMDQITSSEDQSLIEEEGNRVPNPFEGPGGNPPIRFIGDPENREMELTKDPIKATQMFYAMAMNYKQMTDVSAEAEMIHRIVSESNTVDKNGNISEGAPVNLKDSIEEEMEFLISDTRTREEEGKSPLLDFISKDSANPLEWERIRRRKKELENDRDQLKEDFENNEINTDQYTNLDEDDFQGEQMTQNQYDKLLNKLDQQYKDLGGRSLIFSSLIDNTLLSFAQLKGMGLNIGASVRNLGYGLISNFIHAAGGQDFTDSDVFAAFNAIMGDFATRTGKVQALVDRFGILFDTAEVRTGQDRNQTGGRDVYFLQNRTEYFVQGLTMVSMMMNETITDTEGNERSLWEAFNDDGSWNVEEFGQNEDWQSSPSRDEGRAFEEFGNKAIQLNNRLHGDYSKDSNQKLKKYVAGRLVSMFRTWIPEVFAYRFGGRRRDDHLGREVVGSYRGTAEAIKDNPFGATMQILTSVVPYADTETDLSETQKAAIKRTGREMQIWLALSAAILALQPPEDEETNASRKILINNLIMLKQDTQIYWDPTSMNDLIQDPVPAITSLTDFQTAMSNTWEHLLNENYRGKHPARSWASTMPILKQSESIRWQSERILPD